VSWDSFSPYNGWLWLAMLVLMPLFAMAGIVLWPEVNDATDWRRPTAGVLELLALFMAVFLLMLAIATGT